LLVLLKVYVSKDYYRYYKLLTRAKLLLTYKQYCATCVARFHSPSH